MSIFINMEVIPIELIGKINTVDINFKTGKAKLILDVENKQDAMSAYENLISEERLSIKLNKHREKRSLNANNYAWQLITQLAENQGITKEEVYQHHIKEVGVCRQAEIDEKAVDTLVYSWGLHGLGWFAERLDFGKNDGFVLINLYYGSSTYNTKQMTRLIDNIVQDCKAIGIQTKTPSQINEMLSIWESEPNKG